jgi:hypothetical protein
MVPVELRIVEEELDALLPALVGERLQDVLPVRCALDDVPVAHLRVVHGEAVVVLAGDRDVAHARGLGRRHPRRRVELHGIEHGRQVALVLGHGDALVLHHPLAVPAHRIGTPMDEEAEARLLEPGARCQVFRRRCVLGVRGHRCHDDRHRREQADAASEPR